MKPGRQDEHYTFVGHIRESGFCWQEDRGGKWMRLDNSPAERDRILISSPRRGMHDREVRGSVWGAKMNVQGQRLPKMLLSRVLARRIMMKMKKRSFKEAGE
jgi:hypothetical protein